MKNITIWIPKYFEVFSGIKNDINDLKSLINKNTLNIIT